MKNLVLVILCTLVTPLMTHGQNKKKVKEYQSNFTLERFIKLKEHNTVENIYIDLEPNTDSFFYNIETTIFRGQLTIEIFDPNNQSQGKFSIETQVNSANSERAIGVLTDLFQNTETGKWLIKITPVNASGEISINYEVSLKNE